MRNPNARISRVSQSWRVRVLGHRPKFFADSKYGGTEEALRAAREWRDRRWDGRDRNRKLTPEQVREIRQSSDPYKEIAEQYDIHPQYVYQLRRKGTS